MSSRGRFATPADSPLQECSPYRELPVRRESLGFVHHSRATLCHPAPKPMLLQFATYSASFGLAAGSVLIIAIATVVLLLLFE
jgi:hypothetical protein